jgi:hypothetical protein
LQHDFGAFDFRLQSIRGNADSFGLPETSTNELVQASAAITLAKVGAPADKVVPIIVANLPQTNPPSLLFPPGPPSAALISKMSSQRHQRFETDRSVLMNILALSEYAGRARMALPILSNLQTHPLSNIQILASETAAKIKADTKLIRLPDKRVT